MTVFAAFRELFGWVLIGIGLATFGFAGYLVLSARLACSATIVAAIGFVIFRGGLNLIKLAVAARAAAEGRQPAITTLPSRPIRKPVVLQPSLATPKAKVIPGPKLGA